MRLRHMGDPGQGRDVQRLRVRAVHRVPRPKHASVALFHGTAHHAITPRFRSPGGSAPAGMTMDDMDDIVRAPAT
ncbi:hypothetical protein GCM10018952_63740 [Streptosporangium vulgare]